MIEAIQQSVVPFLAILNPFALCLYLSGVMEDLKLGEFLRVLLGACLLSLAVFSVFALSGDYLLSEVLGVEPEAMRTFGGLIFLIVGYEYVTKGYRAAVALRGSLDELPSAIALPFMIGAGTITQSILVGKQHSATGAVAVLIAGIGVALLIVTGFKMLRDHMTGGRERLFLRYVNIMARINGLLIGAISIDMIISGIHGLWNLAEM